MAQFFWLTVYLIVCRTRGTIFISVRYCMYSAFLHSSNVHMLVWAEHTVCCECPRYLHFIGCCICWTWCRCPVDGGKCNYCVWVITASATSSITLICSSCRPSYLARTYDYFQADVVRELPSNLRPTTRECVHSVRCGHFGSHDKDGGHTIQSALPKPLAIRKLYGCMFYRTGVMADRSFAL